MTKYSELYRFIRLCTGDRRLGSGVTATSLFEDDEIDTALDFVIEYEFDEYEKAETEGEDAVDPTITGDDKLLLILKAALCLLNPQDAISFRTQPLSVTQRGEGKERQIEWIEKRIDMIENGGHIPLAVDTDVVAYLEHGSRLLDEIDRAIDI